MQQVAIQSVEKIVLKKNPKILGENILQKALEQIDLTNFLERKHSTEKLFNLVKKGIRTTR